MEKHVDHEPLVYLSDQRKFMNGFKLQLLVARNHSTELKGIETECSAGICRRLLFPLLSPSPRPKLRHGKVR